jgi:hypothetical protein
MNFHLRYPKRFPNRPKNKVAQKNFKELSQYGGQANFAETLHASPFNKDLRTRPVLA